MKRMSSLQGAAFTYKRTIFIPALTADDDSTIQSLEPRHCPLEPPRWSASLAKSHRDSNSVPFLLNVCCVR